MKSFVENIKEKLGIRAKGRKVEGSRDLYHLRESQAAYNSNFTPENSVLTYISHMLKFNFRIYTTYRQ